MSHFRFCLLAATLGLSSCSTPTVPEPDEIKPSPDATSTDLAPPARESDKTGTRTKTGPQAVAKPAVKSKAAPSPDKPKSLPADERAKLLNLMRAPKDPA
jgi:hypothetical protein